MALTQMDLERFGNKIYITRKSRIEASERLIRADKFWQFLIYYYTVLIISFGVLDLKIDFPGDALAIGSIIASVGVLAISVYISNCRFLLRAKELTECYIALDLLNGRIDRLQRELSTLSPLLAELEFKKVQEEYSELLSNVENHTELDMLLAKKSIGTLKENETKKLIISRINRGVTILLGILWPMIILVYSLYKLGE